MEQFFNALKAQAGALDGMHGRPRFGVVSSVDPNRYAARVILQPEGVLTGWLPVLSAWVGAGWGMAAAPMPGQQVLILPQDGDAEHGVVVGAAWSDASPTPGAPAGELWLVHQSGSFLKLLNDGSLRIKAPSFIEGDVQITGNVQVSGDVRVGGDVFDATGPLSRLRDAYNGHIHPGVQPGDGNTATTNSPDIR